MTEDFSYQLRAEFDDYIELVIVNPTAMLQRDRELTFRIDREQVRELAAAFADIDKASVDREADRQAREAGMTFKERVKQRILEVNSRKASQRKLTDGDGDDV